MKKLSFSIIDIVFLLLSLMLCVGTAFVFHACGPKPDGSWMNCHWAEHVVIALGAVFVVLSVARICMRSTTLKAGCTLAFVPLAVVTALVPKVLVPLCMMKDMRCHTVMRPAVFVLSVLLALLSLATVIVELKKGASKR